MQMPLLSHSLTAVNQSPQSATAPHFALPAVLPNHRLCRALGILAMRPRTLYPGVKLSERVVHSSQPSDHRFKRRARTPVRRMLF